MRSNRIPQIICLAVVSMGLIAFLGAATSTTASAEVKCNCERACTVAKCKRLAPKSGHTVAEVRGLLGQALQLAEVTELQQDQSVSPWSQGKLEEKEQKRMRRNLTVVSTAVVALALFSAEAEAACGPTCQAKCREAVSAGAEPSYAFCVDKWSKINAKGKSYAAKRESEARRKWQEQRR